MNVATETARVERPAGEPQSEYERLARATDGLQAPFALVDLDAMWANAADMERRAAGKPIRLASKSVRCRELQRRILVRPGFSGTLAYTLPEALWLCECGTRDLVVAYPSADLEALRELARSAAREHVCVMVDGGEQLALIGRARRDGGAAAAAVQVCIDVDAGWRALGGRVRVGAKRSPLHTPAQAGAFARELLASEGLQLVGIMAYEAQIAGLGDRPPGRPLRAAAIRRMQARSARELATRRAEVVAAVAAELAARGRVPLRFVNGGGTGSLHQTTAERCVTELAGGSGLYAPALFDSYRAFAPRPSALFALPVVRRPGRGVVTVLGGGYLASGSADSARLPQPYLPAGLALDGLEGAGEVQTPLLGAAADALAVGAHVFFRHAKAGELCERFTTLHLLEGDRIVDEVPTYRGEGRCFL
ncbi:MAG TPA: alanine racemase [Solirubrobacteraceae bacterium]|jgi:D-serine deaminase-like pyridoxal phosphate-dependent protein|nr:alanine racemase [Solirubrobacteraceae bacterium]